MDPSEKQGSQQKKSRKALPTSRRSTGAHATASVSGVVPPGGLGVASGAFGGGSGTVAPSSGGGTNSPQAGSGLWTGSSSEWLYPPGGFVNSLQMPYPYVNFPNGNQLPENSHFVGGPSTRGTPSPNGIGLAMDGTDAHETIHIDGDETLEPGRTDRRLNWSHEEDVRLEILERAHGEFAVQQGKEIPYLGVLPCTWRCHISFFLQRDVKLHYTGVSVRMEQDV
ncbi:unnamed protein product [Urochloa decumbens]|uniref:Uncharacterized protein n=1 Tax=Urochloa decumbens TaxID=240449 RepID=A0ABC8ZM73_9POAL